ncbi:MAG: DUF3883 domain-containing protein [Nitrososphaera sp.]
MIDKPIEINHVLLNVNSLSVEKKGADEKSVVDALEKYCIGAVKVNSEESISFCSKIGLLQRYKNRLIMTSAGKEFYNMRTVESNTTMLDLNTLQKQFILDLIFDSPYQDQISLILNDFGLDYSKSIWFYDSEKPNPKWPNPLTTFLFDCEFLIQNNHRIEVNSQTNHLLSKIKHRVSRTEEQLLKILDKQRITGEKAEELTIELEKRRLSMDGFEYLSLAVHRISKEDVFAGFDIISYDGKDSSLDHDRFIEVKGTTGKNPIFYWSKNEIETAKRLGSRYWIYIWTEVGSSSPVLLHRIRNPYLTLFKERAKRPEPVLYAIEL